jgi:hypothetical protein
LGLVGTLLACARTLTRPPTARPDAPAS